MFVCMFGINEKEGNKVKKNKRIKEKKAGGGERKVNCRAFVSLPFVDDEQNVCLSVESVAGLIKVSYTYIGICCCC